MKKKIDSRIQTLIENGVRSKQRTMLVLVGDRSRYQIVNFHFMLTRSHQNHKKPKVLWCYKNDLEFSTHQKKRIKEVKNMQMKGLYDQKIDDPFDLFVSSTQIRYTYYKESHQVLGNTFQMLILQDFQALTPNVLCRTIETVEGGGLVIFLLRTMTSLKQLHTLTMDVHARYRTEAYQDVQPRFNERFLLSLSKNSRCLVMDDELNILPLSEHLATVQQINKTSSTNDKVTQELEALKSSLKDKQIIGAILATAKTLDQAKVLMTLVDALIDKTHKSTVSVTAGRGRGKSAAVGLSIAAAIKLGFSNIFVTAPSPENLKTLFEFICIGLDKLDYKERADYEKVYSTNSEYDNAILRIDINRQHRQFVQFVFPNDAEKIGHCDLMIIDEAAAIPLPYVKSFFGPHSLFMSSTINGYEGTGRSLSLKLIEELRFNKNASRSTNAGGQHADGWKKFREVSMQDPIRYALDDEVERWLTELLLLNATEPVSLKGQRLPHPSQCELYIVNRDALFSYKSSSEKFLFSLMSLFISSHYKNSPNDLQLLSDSASHLLFVLLGPLKKSSDGKTELPDVLCAVQLALEGNLSKARVNENSQRGIKPSGDLIPWNIREQFQDNEFPSLAGGRIVRIATHSKAVKMGYGSRALELLGAFFEGKLLSLDEDIEITPYNFQGEGLKKPLLKKLEEVQPPILHYLGTSFGFTQLLLKFWTKNGYQPVYLRQTVNDITAEHSGIMIRAISNEQFTLNAHHYSCDFRRRFCTLLSFEFRKLGVALALQVLNSVARETAPEVIPRSSLEFLISLNDYLRLKSYSRNQVDYHLIMDLVPILARLYFAGRLGNLSLGYTNQAILVGVGLQMKTIEEVCKDLKDLEPRNALPLFQKTVIKFTKIIQDVYEKQAMENISNAIVPKLSQPELNEKGRTEAFGQEQTAKIFEGLTKQRGKINYALQESDLQDLKPTEQGVVTIKRTLQDARDFEQRPPRKQHKK